MASNLFRRSQGGLPSNIEKNLREEVNAVTLKSGREFEEREKKPKKMVDKGKKGCERNLKRR